MGALPRTLLCIALIVVTSSAASAQSLYGEVNLAIERGIHKLLGCQQQDGSFKNPSPGSQGLNENYPMGVTSLAMYALLKAGVPPDDPAIKKAFHSLRYLPFERTYSVSTLIMAVDAMNNPDHDLLIQKAAGWLEDNLNPNQKLWGYPHGTPDMSNTQYAALALLKAEKHGFEASKKLWESLTNGALRRQTDCGGFGYRGNLWPEAHGTMTASGLTILAICLKHIDGSLKVKAERAVEKGLAYMDRVFTTTGNFYLPSALIKHQHPTNRNTCFHFYYLYGIERAAALNDRTEFGGRNWYNEGVATILKYEAGNDAWEDLVNTSFALLFMRKATFSGTSISKTPAKEKFAGSSWRYTTKKPPDGWREPGFDDSNWAKGKSCFGNFANQTGIVRTKWESTDIWMRSKFEWNKSSTKDFRIYEIHDDIMTVYINGVKAAETPKWTQHYKRLKINSKALRTIKQGENLLAAQCTNENGSQIIDLRFNDIGDIAARNGESKDSAAKRWWKTKPASELPFLRNWLVIGPIKNPDDLLLHNPLPRMSHPPQVDKPFAGSTWRSLRSLDSFINLKKLSKGKDRSIYHAFTYITSKETVNAVLWVGSKASLQVIFDDRILLSHHSHKESKVDSFSIPLRLYEGVHKLHLKIEEFKRKQGFFARITSMEGKELKCIIPHLAPDEINMTETAMSYPSIFTEAEMLEHLPSDVRHKIDFSNDYDLDRISVTNCAIGYPYLIERYNAKGDSVQPNPGARGILALKPVSKKLPVRLIWKMRVPKTKYVLETNVSAEAKLHLGDSGYRIRIGVFSDDELEWIADEQVQSGQKANKKEWLSINSDVSRFVEKDVLIIVECSTIDKKYKEDCAFIDELIIR